MAATGDVESSNMWSDVAGGDQKQVRCDSLHVKSHIPGNITSPLQAVCANLLKKITAVNQGQEEQVAGAINRPLWPRHVNSLAMNFSHSLDSSLDQILSESPYQRIKGTLPACERSM